jgi:hypothetical protein
MTDTPDDTTDEWKIIEITEPIAGRRNEADLIHRTGRRAMSMLGCWDAPAGHFQSRSLSDPLPLPRGRSAATPCENRASAELIRLRSPANSERGNHEQRDRTPTDRTQR